MTENAFSSANHDMIENDAHLKDLVVCARELNMEAVDKFIISSSNELMKNVLQYDRT